ncbi:MAG: MBL fold metallo-hydrolase [Methanosarcinaceae archaeon]|nr:MBL fold metallo-hydrolase [Methanosarcinaceae archaeon]
MKSKTSRWLILWGTLFLFGQIAVSQPQAGTLRIYCIDVDQGSSTLIITPNGKSVLIDCGDDGNADSVYQVISNLAQLSTINYFVCTHYHDDHYGALDKLMDKGLAVSDKFYDRDSQDWLGEQRTETDDYKEYARISGGKREYLRPGKTISVDDGVLIECVVANGRAKGEYGPIEYPAEENGYSLGLMVSYNGFDFLIAGDISKEVETKLVSRGILKDVDVYHVSHHGAETSSSQAFLDLIKPEVCIISSGTNKNHKHPRKVVVERLINFPSEVYQLNKNTDEQTYPSKIKNVPDDHIGDLECDGKQGTILIEVSDTQYFINILSRDLKKTYQTQKNNDLFP